MINVYFRNFLEFILWNYKWEPLIWTKMCVSTFSFQERVLICSMLSLFWPSRLSCWIFLIIKGGIWISKNKIFEFEVKNLRIYPKQKLISFFGSPVKFYFFTNRNHWFGAAENFKLKEKSQKGLHFLKRCVLKSRPRKVWFSTQFNRI